MIRKSNIIIFTVLISSCSTMRKTMIYSAATGAVSGSLLGRSLSPDSESKNFNTVLGALTGAAITAAAGYFFWKDANPDLKLKNPIIPIKPKPLPVLVDPLLPSSKLDFSSGLVPIGEKKYIKNLSELPDKIRKHSKKQYYRKYKTSEVKIEEGNRVYVIPSYEILENGAD